MPPTSRSSSGDLPWTNFTGKMRETERVVRAMPDVGAPAFRLFSAITQGMSEESGTYFCGDEVMAVACGARRRQSLSKARAALAKKGLIEFTPGRPSQATTYRIAISDESLLDLIGALTDRKREARMLAEKDRPRRIGVTKSVRRKAIEIGVGQVAIDDAASRKAYADYEIGVTKSVRAASRKADTLHPRPTPHDSAHAIKVSTEADAPNETPSLEPIILAKTGEVLTYIDAHPSKPAGCGDQWPSQADLARGGKVISDHVESASREVGLSVDQALEAIGDELAKMKRAVAEFPGDEGRAGRRIRRLLRDAKGGARDAA